MLVTLATVTDPAARKTGCLVLAVNAGGKLAAPTQQADKICAGRIAKLVAAEQFKGATGKTVLLHGLPGLAAQRVLLVGMGNSGELDASGYRKAIGAALAAVRGTGANDALFALGDVEVKGCDSAWQLRQIGLLAGHGAYRYTQTLSKPDAASQFRKLVVGMVHKSRREERDALAEGAAIAEGANLARELGNLPANICTPSYLAQQARALARRYAKARMSCKVLNEAAMRKLGMNALLSVTAGTREPARLIVLEYRGAARTEQPHVLVGKGITFDSGGISLKPGAAMDEMKYDMCGAASVLGTFRALADLRPKINVVGIVAACENMPSGTATRPGDVVRSMQGTTIEILNTDAEGRLILCDALCYAKRFKPRSIVDIATLTGACVVALGKQATGLFSPDDELAAQLLEAGTQTHDRAWRMPVWEDYQEQLRSNFADVANIGGPGAGSVTAACFLARFTRGERWAHLDIAGTAWDNGAHKGATGRPVALLTRYLLARA